MSKTNHTDTWASATLGEILPLNYGKGLIAKNRDPKGKFPVYGSSGIVGYHSNPLTSRESLIVGRKGSVGEVHYSQTPCWPIDTAYFVEGNDQFVLKYFFYLLKHLQLGKLDKSTTIPSLSRDDYNPITVSFPSVNVQHRIVAEIEKQFSRLDAGVAALERVRDNLKRYRAAVLKAACEGRLVPQDPADEPAPELLKRILKERRARWEAAQLAAMKAKGVKPKDDKWKSKYTEPAPPDTSKLPTLPKSWTWATIEQLASFEKNSITDGPFGSNLKTSHYTQDGPRVIRLQNIGEGFFIDEHAHISEEHYISLRKHLVQSGDIVIAILGEKLPRACIVPESVGQAIVKADCIRFKPNQNIVFSEYMNVALNSEPLRKQTAKIVHGIGRPRLNLTELKSLCIPLPGLNEQKRICDEVERRLSIVEEIVKTICDNGKRAGVLRQSILKQAFSGKLVPQDPGDKPADTLLGT